MSCNIYNCSGIVEMYEDIEDIKERHFVIVSHVWGNQDMYTTSEFGISNVESTIIYQ